MTETDLEDDTRQPRRRIGKQEVVRHLIHSAIRLISKQRA
jgi:hypothetical protein